MAISTLKPKKTNQLVDEEDDDIFDEEVLEDDALTSEMLELPFVEDFSPPDPPKGFFKVIRGHVSTLIRKSTVLWAMFTSTSRVSTDRLKRFIEEKKAYSRKDDRISVGNYIKIKMDKKIMIGQVLGFKFLSGRREECPMTSCPIVAPKESSKRGIGLMLNLYEINKSGKMKLREALKSSVDIKQFVCHISPNDLENYL